MEAVVDDEAGSMLPATINPTGLTAVFTGDAGPEAMIAEIERMARAFVPDLASDKGRKAIASLAYKIARSKTTLDEAGKDMNSGLREKINAVDAHRRIIRERLDALRDEVRKPLDDWQVIDDARVAMLQSRLDALKPEALPGDSARSTDIQGTIEGINLIEIDDSWAEFQPKAMLAHTGALMHLNRALQVALVREEQAAELAQLRAAVAARAEADRIAAEAAEAARAKAEADKAEQDRLQREADAAKAQAEAAEAAARVRAEEAAERARKEAADLAAEVQRDADDRAAEAERLARDRETALQRQLEEQRAATERAAQAERDRIKAAADVEAAAKTRREADENHRRQIGASVSAAVEAVIANLTLAEVPGAIGAAIMAGKIPHITVNL